MANSGIVKTIVGDVVVIAVDEEERLLKVGERVLFNERIITGDNGLITIEFSDGTTLGLGINTNVILDDALNLDLATKQPDQIVGSVEDEVAAIQQALADDQEFDPSKLDATAAGGQPAAGGGTENGGHSIVGIDYLNPQRTPDSGFETLGNNNQALFLDVGQPELILEPRSAVDDIVSPPPPFEAPLVLITDHNGSELGENRIVEDSAVAVTGTFVLVTPEGLSSLTVGGQIISEADLLENDALSIDILTDQGTLTIDGFDATTGVVNYSYIAESGAKDHSDGDESIVDQIEITVTDDSNVTSASEILDVLIADTAPIAIDNVESMSQEHTWFSDNVIFNLRNGGDTAPDDIFAVDETRLQSVTFNETEKDFLNPEDLISNGLGEFIEFDTDNGKLLIREDGQYWYKNTDLTDGESTDTFDYQLIDADGDISVATLTINQVLGDNINTGVDVVFV